MTFALSLIALVLTLALAAPMGLFCLEVLFSLWTWREGARATGEAPRCAVLIPAHDEETVLAATLETLRPTLGARDSVLVVADNCTDATAEIARQHGAEVIERAQSTKRGKGYALDFGLQHLAHDPPEVVVFVDADCRVAPDTVAVLAEAAYQTQRPVQGLNLCDPDPDKGPLQAVSGLAFRFKNLVRTMGVIRLGGNCYLTGTGMALPWKLVREARLANGNVVEDMQLGIDLALAGKPPLFVPAARVDSPLPEPPSAARTQRTRWEHGHLRTILTQCPRLLALAVRKMRWDLLLLALDLSIPPLSLLVITWMLIASFAYTVAWFSGDWTAAIIASLESCALEIAVLTGWFVHCRRQVPFLSLVTAPLYALGKLPIYIAFLTRRQTAWIRTQRPAAEKKNENTELARRAS